MMRSHPTDRPGTRSDRGPGDDGAPVTGGAVRRDLILETAAGVFAELGYRQTWAGDLLSAAGIHRDILYPDFVDKEACFLAVLDRAVAEGRALMADATRGHAGWTRQTYAALQALLLAMDVGSPNLRILLIEAPTAGTAAVARYDRVCTAAAAWLYKARRRYPAAADLPDCFERMVVDGVTFILRQCLLEYPRPPMPELLLETSRYVIEPFAGPDEFRRLESEVTASPCATE